jgi:hypothetical protein
MRRLLIEKKCRPLPCMPIPCRWATSRSDCLPGWPFLASVSFPSLDTFTPRKCVLVHDAGRDDFPVGDIVSRKYLDIEKGLEEKVWSKSSCDASTASLRSDMNCPVVCPELGIRPDL